VYACLVDDKSGGGHQGRFDALIMLVFGSQALFVREAN